MSGSRITVVLDAGFGAKMNQQAALGPIWVVRSATNESAIEKLWKNTDYTGDHLTIFNGGEDAPEDTALGILDAVDLHHPGWTTIEVIGARPTATLTEALSELGNGTVETTLAGFIFSRSAVSA